MIEYHNPEAEVGVEITPYTLSASVKGSNAISIGFLANGFPDSENFLKELESVLKESEPGIQSISYNKGNASVAASDELLNEIKGDCQAAIAAYGH